MKVVEFCFDRFKGWCLCFLWIFIIFLNLWYGSDINIWDIYFKILVEIIFDIVFNEVIMKYLENFEWSSDGWKEMRLIYFYNIIWNSICFGSYFLFVMGLRRWCWWEEVWKVVFWVLYYCNVMLIL